VNKATEHVVASDVKRRGSCRVLSSGGHTEVDATMRPLSVVVTDVLPKDSIEMASAHDEQPVEAFVSNRPDPTLCERVVISRQLQPTMKVRATS
jgi:hypothetical protein